MNLIKTKMPEIANKTVSEKDRELYEQITLIWDAIHSNLMNHFSRYSERGEQLVHSTLSSYKLVRINRIIRSSSNSELKQQLDKLRRKKFLYQFVYPLQCSKNSKPLVTQLNTLIYLCPGI